MAKEFLGRGWKFPVKVETATGRIATAEYEQDIRESILIILGTARGERMMRPDFGCGIHELVFASINTATINLVENSVQEALTRWEPRIELIKVLASDEYSAEGKLPVNIDYKVRVTNNRFNLVYPFYLKEGR